MQDVTHLAMASELTAGKEQQHTVGFDMLSALTTTKSDKPETTVCFFNIIYYFLKLLLRLEK